MSTFQFLFLRSAIAFIFNLIMINRNLKMVIWDSVGKENRCNLAAKVTQGLILVFFSFSAVKYFPLTYCNLFRGLSPFFALILSAICLSEVASFRQAFVMTLATAFSIGFVVSGQTDVDEFGLATETKLIKVYAWSVLIASPLLMAIG